MEGFGLGDKFLIRADIRNNGLGSVLLIFPA
jgi:hypothetical protein